MRGSTGRDDVRGGSGTLPPPAQIPPPLHLPTPLVCKDLSVVVTEGWIQCPFPLSGESASLSTPTREDPWATSSDLSTCMRNSDFRRYLGAGEPSIRLRKSILTRLEIRLCSSMPYYGCQYLSVKLYGEL